MKVGSALLVNAVFWLFVATLPPLVILWILVIPGVVFWFAVMCWGGAILAEGVRDEW